MNTARGFARRGWLCATLLAMVLLGCATPPAPSSPDQAVWRGRMALNIDSTPAQRWQAGFALFGDARQGELHVLSPLGNTLAQALWTPLAAQVQRGDHTEHYRDTADMTLALTGANLPLSAMFAWLRGQDTPIDGWTLQRPSPQLLIAQRNSPKPKLSLRIVLNHQP